MTLGARGDSAAQEPQTQILRKLDDVVAERGITYRDCRDCRNFEPAEDGLQYGWCSAHKQYVKLYHPSSSWYSQCLFKNLRRVRPDELTAADGELRAADVSDASRSTSDRT